MWLLYVDLNKTVRRKEYVEHLEAEGHVLHSPKTLFQAQSLALSGSFDLILLAQFDDVHLTYTFIRSLRESGSHIPLLVILQSIDVDQQIQLLDVGANDVVSGPFDIGELMARIRVHGRQKTWMNSSKEELEAGGIQLDFDRHVLISELGQIKALRSKEFKLLELFMSRPDKLVSRSVIAERVWDTLDDVSDDAINMTVSSLRKKLDTAQRRDRRRSVGIQTIRGYGYIFSIS